MKPGIAALHLLGAAAPLVSAFVVPEDLANGVYAFSYDGGDAQAIAKFEMLAPISSNHTVDSSTLEARQRNVPPPLEKPQTQCGNANINRGDFDRIKEEFKKMCDKAESFPGNSGILITYGNAIAYMCNYEFANRCWAQEYDEASGLVDRQCGTGRSGTVYVDRWKKSYGRDAKDANICWSV